MDNGVFLLGIKFTKRFFLSVSGEMLSPLIVVKFCVMVEQLYPGCVSLGYHYGRRNAVSINGFMWTTVGLSDYTAARYYRGNGHALNVEHRGVCEDGERLHGSTARAVLLLAVTVPRWQ